MVEILNQLTQPNKPDQTKPILYQINFDPTKLKQTFTKLTKTKTKTNLDQN